MGKTGKTDGSLPTGEPDIRKLEEFSGLNEKQHTPFYAGRENIIKKILGATKIAARRAASGERPKGETWVVQGAPGAGKTALLEELGRDPESRGCEPWKEDMPVVSTLPLASLDSERETTRIIAKSLLEGADARYRQATEREGRVALGIFGGSISRGRATVTAPPEATLDSLNDLPSECWRRPLIVTVDEVQDVTPSALNVLRQLHLGEHGLPIIPVYGGLANSANMLDQLPLTRIVPEQIVLLEGLKPSEARRAIERLLDECNVKNRHKTMIAKKLAEQTEGWPQHLHNGMRVLAKALVETGGNMDRVCESEVLEEEAKIRENRHEARKTPEMEEVPVFVARLMTAALRQKMKLPELLEQMAFLSKAGKRADERLPEDMSAKEFLNDHLVRKGALHKNSGNVFVCPIPCFSRHLIEAGGDRGRIDMLSDTKDSH